MNPIEIVPHERDKAAKDMYIFLQWFIRKNKRVIKNEASRVLADLIIHGEGASVEEFRSETNQERGQGLR